MKAEHSSRFDESGTFKSADIGASEVWLVPNEEIDSEKLYAYELGYKTQINDDLYFDISSFYHDYKELRASEVGASYLYGATVVTPLKSFNTGYGESYGFEISADWDVKPNWRLEAGYSFVETHLHMDTGHTSTIEDSEGDAPKNQFNVRSYWNITPNLELDNSLYYVDSISNIVGIEPYFRLDTRLGWKPTKSIEFSIAGQKQGLEELG